MLASLSASCSSSPHAQGGATAPVQAGNVRAEEAAHTAAALLQGAVGPDRSAWLLGTLIRHMRTPCPHWPEPVLPQCLPCTRHAGALTTAGVLCVGFGAFINGNKVLAQNMLRARVAAQAATVAAMTYAASSAFTKKPEPQPEPQ